MTSAYPINAPVEFVNTAAGDALLFNANSTGSENAIVDFVTDAPGDLLVRAQGNENALDRIAIGTAGQVLTATGVAVAGEYTITTVADVADSLNGTYFTLNSPSNAYYFWLDTGTGVDPGTVQPVPNDLLVNGALKTGNQVTIATNDTAAAVATALDAVIDGLADFSTVLAAPLITVTNAAAGSATDPADGTAAATGFTIGTTTPGSSTAPAWATPSPGSEENTFQATGNTPVASSIATGAAWVPVDSSVITWDDSTLPNHDAGALFDPATGVFTVPDTGIYTLSASVSLEGNNRGTGAIGGRRAVRQMRVMNTTTAVAMSFAEAQAQAFGDNPTHLETVTTSCSLTAADTIRVEVRHDADTDLALVDEDSTGSGTSSIIFTASRIA